MGGSAGIAARLLAIAVLVVIAMGVYVFMVKTDLQAAQAKIATVELDRDAMKKKVDTSVMAAKSSDSTLSQCKSQVTDLQAQLDAMSKKPAGKK